MRPCQDCQIAAVPDTPDQRGCPRTFTARDIHVKGGAAFLFGAIIINGSAKARLGNGVEECSLYRMMVAQPVNADGTVIAAIIITAGKVCFQRAEVGQHIIITPPGRAGIPPAVKILPVSTNIDHAVQR